MSNGQESELELDTVQRLVQHVIVHAGTLDDALESVPNSPAVLRAVVRGTARLAGEARMQIYRDAYRARLAECLAADYPALRAWVGPERFNALCQTYVAREPPRAPSLNEYGRAFPAFCASLPGPDRGLLADLARIEWAAAELIHEPAEAPLDPRTLNAHVAAWATTRLCVRRSVRLLQLDHPLATFYPALIGGERPEPPNPAVSHVIVHRANWQVHCFALTQIEAQTLALLLAGETIDNALALADGRGVQEAEIAAWFQRWLSAGLFAGIASGGDR